MASSLQETTGEREIEASDRSSSDELLRDIARIDDAPKAIDLVGTRLGRFRVVKLLGRGGMGVVYHAVDETLRRDVAIKVLPPAFSHDEERRRRFLREARLAAAVSHPCLTTVHEVGEDEGRIFIVMALRGQSLAAVLAERRLPVPEALRISLAILDGVGKAHEAGLVHRDLKPDNVMLTDDGAVRVLDFGLAKPEERATSEAALEHAAAVSHVTTDGRIVGTPSYMSPEQARGEAVDRRSDVFSFGVMLYEMLAGQRPFVGEKALDIMKALLREEPEALSTLSPEVSPDLSRVVRRCLAKQAHERYADCGSLASDLGRVLGTAGAPAARRRRRVWALGASLGLALASVGFVLLRTKAPGVAALASASASAPAATEPEAQRTATTRASGFDPRAAVSWYERAQALAQLGRADEALAAFDRCIEISHGSPGCLAGRASLHGFHGRCSAMEEDVRRAIAGSPSVLSELYGLRAKALHALGRPEEAVLEVLAQKWALLPEETRRTEELQDRAAIAFDRGDFTRAAALLEEASRLSSASPEAVLHHSSAQWVGVLVEMGHPRDAATVAADYLERVDAWRGGVEYGDTMCMLRAMLHAGTLSPEAFSAKRASWLERARPAFGSTYQAELWAETYGVHVETPEEASTKEEAKEALSTLSAVPTQRIDPANPTSLPLGEVYVLAGRPDDALPFLRREERSCFGLGSPVHARNAYYLGLALEQEGDKPGACDAYAAMLARWGNARPRSVTADKARERAKALGCPR